jgi:hypothetical protein
MSDTLDQIADEIRADMETRVVTSKQELIQHYTMLGLTLARGAQMMGQNLEITPEVKRKVSDGNFAIGEERQKLMTGSNITAYAMVYFCLGIADDTDWETGMMNAIHFSVMMQDMLRMYYSKKQENPAITPTEFMETIAREVEPDEPNPPTRV